MADEKEPPPSPQSTREEQQREVHRLEAELQRKKRVMLETGIGPVGVRMGEEGTIDPESVFRAGRIKVRLTLGPALIDLEATLEEIVVVVTRLTQEFSKAAIITEYAGKVAGM